MKKVITFILLALFVTPLTKAQSFECRVAENDYGYLVYQMREISGTGTPTTSTIINDITFVIRYPAGAVDVELLCSTNDYNLVDGLGTEQTSSDGNYDYHYWNAMNTPFSSPHDWVTNEWEDIGVFKVTSATGSGLFEVAPNGWHPNNQDLDLNWNQGDPPVDYTPVISGSGITYSYPTTVYSFVWTGANTFHGAPLNPTVWEEAGNWDDECAQSQVDYPWLGTENVFIPDVSSASSYFPEMSGGYHDGWICNNMLIGANAHVTVPDLSSANNKNLDVQGNLIVNGKLYLPALGYATVTGSTEIDAAAGIEIQADATGVGSFIDNGTITYGTSGSGKVQTYLTNTATAGNYHLHTVGPTVDVGSAGGAVLSDFDLVAGSTYAYNWDETQPVADGWQNIYSNSYLVATGDGIALSTTDATDHTLEMTGTFITGNTSPPALTYSNNYYELISNPYPSSIDFDAFYTANSSVINNEYWIWNPTTGSYENRVGGVGSQQYVQVGQAFFIETNSAGTVQFTNALRAHSSDAFRETIPNMLTMKAHGGDMGYSDKLIVRFTEDATNGYDVNLDGKKWNSMYEDATMIRSIAEDGSELAINALPLDGLQGDMVSVPVNFNCGYTAEYTFDFEGIDSFEAGNEVWLEDKKDNDKWIYLNNNPHYTFTATSYEPNDRFIIHFFGPTNINDKDEAKVDIYSWQQYAVINNVTNEKIKEVSIYNMAGSLITEREIPDGQKLSKIWVSDHMAYYVVQVITEKSVYTNKILITK